MLVTRGLGIGRVLDSIVAWGLGRLPQQEPGSDAKSGYTSLSLGLATTLAGYKASKGLTTVPNLGTASAATGFKTAVYQAELSATATHASLGHAGHTGASTLTVVQNSSISWRRATSGPTSLGTVAVATLVLRKSSKGLSVVTNLVSTTATQGVHNALRSAGETNTTGVGSSGFKNGVGRPVASSAITSRCSFKAEHIGTVAASVQIEATLVGHKSTKGQTLLSTQPVFTLGGTKSSHGPATPKAHSPHTTTNGYKGGRALCSIQGTTASSGTGFKSGLGSTTSRWGLEVGLSGSKGAQSTATLSSTPLTYHVWQKASYGVSSSTEEHSQNSVGSKHGYGVSQTSNSAGILTVGLNLSFFPLHMLGSWKFQVPTVSVEAITPTVSMSTQTPTVTITGETELVTIQVRYSFSAPDIQITAETPHISGVQNSPTLTATCSIPAIAAKAA